MRSRIQRAQGRLFAMETQVLMLMGQSTWGYPATQSTDVASAMQASGCGSTFFECEC